jgi:hypothetical protein
MILLHVDNINPGGKKKQIKPSFWALNRLVNLPSPLPPCLVCCDTVATLMGIDNLLTNYSNSIKRGSHCH